MSSPKFVSARNCPPSAAFSPLDVDLSQELHFIVFLRTPTFSPFLGHAWTHDPAMRNNYLFSFKLTNLNLP